MHAAFYIYRIRTRTQVRAGLIGIFLLGWTSIFFDLAKEFKNAFYCLASLWKHGRSLEKDDDSDDENNNINQYNLQ